MVSDSTFIIMDEPTSALSDEERKRLFDIIKRLKDDGLGIVYITHRMKEIFEIAELVTVMRDSRK